MLTTRSFGAGGDGVNLEQTAFLEAERREVHRRGVAFRAPLVRHMLRTCLARAWRGWREAARQQERARRVGVKFASKLQHRQLWAAFDGWSCHSAERWRQRRVAARFLARWRLQRLGRAYTGFGGRRGTVRRMLKRILRARVHDCQVAGLKAFAR